MALVPAASRPSNSDIASGASIVAQALRDLGVNAVAVSPTSPGASTATIPLLAAQALREIGVNPVAEADMAADASTYTVTEIAAWALRSIGINPIAESAEGAAPASRTPDYLAQNALKLLGVNPVEQASAPGLDPQTFTQQQIGALALAQLGIYSPDETPDAADSTTAATYVVAFHNHLASMNAVHWLETAIPTQVSILYVLATAASMGPAFGKPLDAQGYATALAAVKQIALTGQYAQTFALDHVAMVHNELIGLNLASWGLSNVPDALSETYSKLAAIRMAPAFGQPIDQASYAGQPLDQAYEAAIATVRTFALSGAYGQAAAEARVTSVHENLAGKNLVSWAITAIPARVFDAYTTLTIQALAPMVKMPVSPELSAAAEASIRIMALSGAYGQALAEAKVTEAHEALNALGLVSWASTAIPTAAAPGYVTMAAMMLAPSVGKQSDAKAYDDAVQSVRLIVLSGAYATAFGTAALTNVHDGLVAAAIVPWTLTAIPAAAAESYSVLVSAQLAPTYNKAIDPEKVRGAGQQIETIVMVMGSQALAEQILREWHAEWRDRNMTRWELFDIPRSAEESYIAATGVRLAPQFPGARSPDNLADAEARLYRIITLESTGQPVQADYF